MKYSGVVYLRREYLNTYFTVIMHYDVLASQVYYKRYPLLKILAFIQRSQP